MPQAVVGALVSAGAATYLATPAAIAASGGLFGLGAGTVAGFFARSFAINLALSAVAQALQPKPSNPVIGPQKQTITARSSNQTRKLVYGTTKVGGTFAFIESTNDDRYLHLVVVMAAHEIDQYVSFFFNDEELSLSGNDVTSPSKYANYVKVYPVTKGSVANIPASLISDTSWTADHVLEDQAYVYIRLEYNQDAFPAGLPNISAKIQGRKVYDTRSETIGFSRNPALIIRDYLIDDTYGLGATSAEINEPSFVTAANICDETVSLDAGGSETRYTLDGLIDTGDTPRGAIEKLLTAMNGSLYYSNGQWSIRAGAYNTPTVTLDEDDLAGPMTIDTAVSARDSFNSVKGQFISPETEYQASDYPELTSSTFISEDNGEKRYLNLDLPYTTSSSMAQRIAKQVLYKNRQEIVVTAKFKMSAFQFEVGDTLLFTNSRMGWSEKPFEVVSWQLNFSDQEVSVEVTLSETNSAVYAWDAEEVSFIQDNTNLPSVFSPPAPTNLTLTATAIVNDDGATIPAIRADWDVVNAGFVQYYEIQYKRLGGEEDWGSITVSPTETENYGSIADAYTEEEEYGLISETILTPDAEYTSIIGTTNSFTIVPVLNNYDYNIRVRSINAFGARSAFTSSTLASAGDTTPPSEPTIAQAVALYKAIEINWVNPPDLDLDFVEVWENTTDNLGSASLIGTSGSTNFLRSNLSNNVQRYYWLRAVDLSGNKSDFTSSVNATTLLIAPNDFNDAVNDLFQEAGAFGIEPVDSLPASGDFDGQLKLLKSDITIYRWDATAEEWSTDLYTASNVEAGTITAGSFAAGIEPVSIVDTLPSPTGYTGPSVVFLTSDNKLYRYNGTSFTAATSTQDLTGTLGAGLFPADLRPIERVASLPTTDLTQGRVVLLTTDNKLYRYTGSGWTANIAASDLTGQLSGTQIADGAITTTKITDDAVVTAKIAANAITANEIASNAVTAAKISAGSVSADKIATNAIVAGKVAADAITAGTIAAGAINASDLFVSGVVNASAIATDAIIADKIAAGSIISSKIGAGAVTAEKISVSELSAISADLGTIKVGTANFADTLSSTGFDPDSGTGWQIKLDGSTIFRDMDIRGTISAASRNIKTDTDKTAPLQAVTTQTFTNPGFNLGSSIGTLTMSDLFYAPDHGAAGLVATRLSRFQTDIIITVLATQRISSGSTVLQVKVDSGAWTTIQTVPNPNASFAGQMMNFLHVYTTPSSFDTIQFRVTNTAGVSTGYDQMYILAQANNF